MVERTIIIKGKGTTSCLMPVALAQFPEAEIWILNDDPIIHASKWPDFITRCFDIHSDYLYTDTECFRDQVEKFCHWSHDIPGYIPLPIEDLKDLTPGRIFFKSTVCYMLAMSALENNVEVVYLVGCDYMHCERERSSEIDCIQFWLGYLMGQGKKIKLAPGTRLLEKYLYE